MKETQPPATTAQTAAITDEQLLERFRANGDLDAFDQLVHRYEGDLYRYLRHYVGDSQIAEDLFQATFLKVYQRADQFRTGGRVRPWLYSIATHQAIDWLRKTGRRPALSLDTLAQSGEETGVGKLLDLLEADTPTPAMQFEMKERAERVQRTVSELPEHLRAVAVLVFFQGLKYSEVAEVLGIPLGTVKSRIHTALVRLNEAWRHQQPA